MLHFPVVKMLLILLSFVMMLLHRESDCRNNAENVVDVVFSGKAWKLTPKHGRRFGTCRTPACLTTGQSMLSSVNFSVDPCQDFYQFACGNWIAQRPLYPAENYRSVSGDLQTLVQYQLRDVLTANTTAPLSAAQNTARKFYAQCMDEDLSGGRSTTSLIALLTRILGGWPLITPNWSSETFDHLSAVTELSRYGIGDLFVDTAVVPDPNNSTRNVLFLSPATGFGKDFLQIANGKQYIRTYPNLIKNVALYLRFASELPKFSMENLNYLLTLGEDIKELQELHMFLTNVTSVAAEYYAAQPSNTIYTNLSEFRSVYFSRSHFASSFVNHVQTIVQRSANNTNTTSLENYGISNETEVYTAAPLIMEAIDGKLAELERTGKGRRILASYLGWQFIASYSATFPRKISQHFQNQMRIIAGVSESLPKWMDCVKTVRSVMPAAVGALYVKKYVEVYPTAKKQVTKMIKNLRQEFRRMVSKADWMDTSTRSRALNKLRSMLEYDLYEEHLLGNSNVVNDLYSRFKLEDSLFDTTLSWAQITTAQRLARFGMSNNRADSFLAMDASATNGFYNPPGNFLAILAGIAQAPYLNWEVPDYYTYGALGWVIGHEITHGFDNAGSQRDDKGNMFNWWSNKSRTAFDDKATALAKQFSRYKVGDRHVDGMLTLAENIADLGGIKAAFGAYTREGKRAKRPEQTLPGFEYYSPAQMFFLSAAQIWCGHYDPEFEQLTVLTDVHSPLHLRVNGIFANANSFASAYQCPAGAPMNPDEKVDVW